MFGEFKLLENAMDGVKGASDSGVWSWLGNNANELKSVGTLVGGLGAGYGAWTQAKAMDKVNKLNLDIYNDAKKKQDENDEAFKLGFANSSYGKGA